MGQATGFGTGLSTNVLGYAVAERLRCVFFAGKGQNVVMLPPIFFQITFGILKLRLSMWNIDLEKKRFTSQRAEKTKNTLQFYIRSFLSIITVFWKTYIRCLKTIVSAETQKKSLFEIIPSSCLVRHFLENPRFLYAWLHSYKPLKPEIYTNRFWGQKKFSHLLSESGLFFQSFSEDGCRSHNCPKPYWLSIFAVEPFL